MKIPLLCDSPSQSLCPMSLLKASVEAAVVTCVSRSCLQDLLPERHRWQGPDWWRGKQMSGESASFCSGCVGCRSRERLICREGPNCMYTHFHMYLCVYIYIRKLFFTSVSKDGRKAFVEGFILKWKSPQVWGFVSLRSSNKGFSETELGLEQWQQAAWREAKVAGDATEWQPW